MRLRSNALDGLLSGDDRVMEHHDRARASLTDFRAGRGDLGDLLIARINRGEGCEATATFDRKAARLDGFMRVG